MLLHFFQIPFTFLIKPHKLFNKIYPPILLISAAVFFSLGIYYCSIFLQLLRFPVLMVLLYLLQDCDTVLGCYLFVLC